MENFLENKIIIVPAALKHVLTSSIHPKNIIGYSDTTALLLGIYAKTGLVTFYGLALASSFGEFPPFVDMTFDNFKSVICDGVVLPYEYKMPDIWTDEFINWRKTLSRMLVQLKEHFHC